MAAGSIIIDLLMRTGSFETDTKRAEKALQELQDKVTKVGTAIGVSLVAGATAAFAAFSHFSAMAGEFKDLEEETGATAEALASLSIASAVAGVSVADLAGQMNRLTKNLSGVDDESSAAGAALAALGIPIEDFKKLDPVEQIDALTKAFNSFADGSSKTAVAMALFGKQGAQMLKVFKELEAEGGRQVILTQQQIELADEHADKAAKLRATLSAYAQAAATDVLPAMNDLTAAAKEVIAEFTGIDASGKKLASESPVKEFAEKAVDALAFIVDAGQGVVRTFQVIGKTIGGTSAELGALARGDLEAARQISKEVQADIDNILNEDLFSQRIERLREKARQAAAQASEVDTGGKGGDFGDELKFDGKAKKSREERQSEAQRYLETLQKQSEKTQDLSHAEQALADIQAKRIKGLTPELEKQIVAEANLLDVLQAVKAFRDGEVATQTAIGKAQASSLEELRKGNEELQKEIDLIGLSREEQAARELQLVRVTRAEKQATLAKKEAQGVDETQLQTLQQEIDLLTQREALLTDRADRTAEEQGKQFAAKTAADTRDKLADEIEAGLLEGFRRGDSLVDIFLRELKAQFAKTILRPLIQPIADTQNNAIGSLLQSLGAIFGGGDVPITSGGSPDSQTGEQIRGRRAIGGPVSAGQTYLVGEHGPEPFVPNTAGRIYPTSALGGSRPVNVQIQNNGQPVRATSTTEETDTGTLVKIVLDAVAGDVASGSGKVSKAMKSRGISMDRSLAVRG